MKWWLGIKTREAQKGGELVFYTPSKVPMSALAGGQLEVGHWLGLPIDWVNQVSLKLTAYVNGLSSTLRQAPKELYQIS